jgi:hypothetical protein
MLTAKQLETVQELKEHGYILSHQGPDGEVYLRKRSPGMTGGPPEYLVIEVNPEGEVVEGDE